MLEFRSDSYVASYWWVHKASFLKVSVPLGPGTVVAVAIFGPTLDHPKVGGTLGSTKRRLPSEKQPHGPAFPPSDLSL